MEPSMTPTEQAADHPAVRVDGVNKIFNQGKPGQVDALVDIDLRDLAAQEDNLGGLLTVDAAHEEYAAELSFERLEPIPGNPRCGQGQPPEEADDQ